MSSPVSEHHKQAAPLRAHGRALLCIQLLVGLVALLATRGIAQVVMPASGSLVGWGSNQEGQFGAGQAVGRAMPASISRITVGLTSKTVKLLAAGPSHSLAVTTDNQIFTWGQNDYGQLGVGDTTNRRLPTAVSDLNSLLTGKTIVEVSLGTSHTLVRTADNVLIAWGRNDSGQLGNSTYVNQSYPVAVTMTGALAGKTVAKIAAGGQHTVACTTDGNAYAWGSGGNGANGFANGTNISAPGLVSGVGVLSSRLVQSVAAGVSHSAALLQGGSAVYCWGGGGAGQLGNNNYVAIASAVAVVMSGTLAGKTVTAIASSPGSEHTLALTSDGLVAGWGLNNLSQLGNGTTTNAFTPVAVTTSGFGGKLPVAIYAGQSHNYAVAADGSVFGWGLNSNAQLGNNSLTTLTRPTPVRLAGALSGKTVAPTAYSLGGSHSMAFDSDGKVAVWGANTSGQLGTSNLERSLTPVALLGRDMNSKTFSQVAAGEDFVVALSNDVAGAVFTWGGNSSGQLGNGLLGTPFNVGTPVSGGSMHLTSVTLTSGSVVSGSLRVTVANTTGLLPGLAVSGTNIPPGATVASVTNGTTFQLSEAATASASALTLSASGQTSLPAVTELGVGQRHVLAVAGGKLYAWGDNTQSQLGDGSSTARSTPVLVAGGSLANKLVTKVAGGYQHSLALDSTGTLYAWGYNQSGQLGNNSLTTRSTPVAVTGGSLAGRVVTAVAAAANGSFALAGSLAYAWGDNSQGQLGDGTNTLRTTPVAVSTAGVLSGKTLTHIAAGFNHVVVRSSDGLLFAWGQNDRGQLGTGNTTASNVPVAVKMTGALQGKTALKIWAGPASQGTIVLASDLKLYTWGGRGEVGQSGNGLWNLNLEPVQVSVPGALASAALGNGFGVAAASDNFISTWGSGELGQLGNQADALLPARNVGDLLGLGGKTLASVVAGHAVPDLPWGDAVYPNSLPFQLALDTAGTAYGWGRNDFGQLAQGTLAFSSSLKPIVAGTAFSQLAAGGHHALAVGANGTLYAWGRNQSGQLGNGTTATATAPVALSAGSLAGQSVIAAAAGNLHSLALSKDGKVFAWGNNAYGQLGTGGTVNSTSPVAVAGGSLAGKFVTAVAASNRFAGATSYALSSDGAVFAWGTNSSGQLGTGNTVSSNSPVATVTSGALLGKRITALAAGSEHVLALGADGQIYAWGRNNWGQLGDGSTVDRTSPLAISNIPGTVVAVAAQGHSSLALTADGLLYGWGWNDRGQIGDGTTGNRTSPTLLGLNDGSVSQILSIAALGSSSMAWDTGSMAFAVQPQDATVVLGGTFTLTCAVNTPGVALSYQWWQEVAQTDGSLRWLPVSGAATPVHTVTGADSSSFGRYYVEVTSHLGTLASRLTTVSTPLVAPLFSTTPLPNLALTSGNTATLSVPGTPSGTSYQWKKNGTAIAGATGLTYTLNSADATAAGTYMLTVTNALGSDTSPGLVVTVTPSTGYVAWGARQFGLIGDGSSIGLQAVDTSTGLAGKIIVEMSTNSSSVLVRTSGGSLYAWGRNDYGGLGDGTNTNRSTPVPLIMSGSLAGQTVTALAGAGVTSYALTASGSLYAWGSGSLGQLGNGSWSSSNVPVPVQRGGVLAGKTVTHISAASPWTAEFCLARTSDGQLFSWGGNNNGQLGNGSTTNSNVPVAVTMSGILAGKTATAISAGVNGAVILASDGKLYAWGNSFLLGNGSTQTSTVPVAVDMSGVLAGKVVSKIAVLSSSVLVLTNDNKLFSWGNNGNGQLGNGSSTTSYLPVAVDMSGALAGKAVVDIAGSENFCVVKTSDNSFFSWGANGSGQLGDGSYVQALSPVAVKLPEEKTFTTARTTSSASVFLTSAGEVYTVGDWNSGQLGVGATPPLPGGSTLNPWLQPTPVAVPNSQFGAGGSPVAISAGLEHALALMPDGKVYAWGADNSFGQLGTGSYSASLSPVNISGSGVLAGKTVVALAAGYTHSLALTSDGQLIAWGSNGNGQLGNGSNASSPTPNFVAATPEMAGKRFSSVAAAGETSIALTADGRVFVWGRGIDGQLGNGTTNSASAPVLVGGTLASEIVVAIAGVASSAGNYGAVYALTVKGRIYAWGANNNGHLGNGSNVSSLVPEQVGGVFASKKATAISASNYCVLATSEDGQLYTWGSNTTQKLPSPVAGLSGQTVQAFAIGGQTAAALTSSGSIYAWGYNGFGGVGDTTTTSRSVPVPIHTFGALSGRRFTGLFASGPMSSWGGGGGATTLYALDSARVAFTAPPLSTAVLSGGSVTLNAGVHAPGISVRFQWKKQTTVNGSPAWVSIEGATSTQYTLPVVDASTVGTFALEAVTPAGSFLSPAAAVSLLTTAPAFDLSVTPAPVNLNIGDPLNLSLPPSAGSGPLTYQWRLNGAPISGATSATYSLASAPASASGRYTLTVTNGLGSATSAALSVQVGPVATVTSGSFAAWGANFWGQIGDGKGIGRTSMVAVDKTGVLAGKTVVQVAASGEWGNGNYVQAYSGHSLAVTQDGKVYSWGYNSNGQLGNGTAVDSSVPVAVLTSGALAGKTVTAVAAARRHSLALTSDGKVYGWGANSGGQLGDGTYNQSTVPVAVSTTGTLSGKTVVQISAANDQSYAVTSDGKVFAWGSNNSGQMGDGTSTPSNVPVAVSTSGVLSGKTITAVSAGYDHALALSSDGQIFSWGYAASGRLGNNSGANSTVPVAVVMTGALAGKTVTAVAARSSGSCALTSDGQIFSWGQGPSGALGNGTNSDSYVPTAVSTSGALSGKTVVKIAGANTTVFALTSDGLLVGFGDNSSGMLGNGNFLSSLLPVAVQVPSGVTISQLGGGFGHALFLSSSGDVYAIGGSAAGQLGDGSPVLYTNPVLLPSSTLGGKNIVAVGGGVTSTWYGSFTQALTSDGALYAWGVNSQGQLGTGPVVVPSLNGSTNTFTPNANVPQAVSTGLPLAAISNNSGTHELAVSTDGRLLSWGGNSSGQLGNGNTSSTSVPALISSVPATAGKVFVAVAALSDSSLALSADGKVFAWGLNNSGQLGNGTLTSSYVPVLVGGSSALSGCTVIGIAGAKWGTGYALTLDGRLFAWGDNGAGQLGPAKPSGHSPTPVEIVLTASVGGVSAPVGVAAIAAGEAHVLLLASNGQLYSLGSGDNGQLGNGGYSNSNVPVAVQMGAMAGKTIAAIAACGDSSMALTSDGSVYAWGDNLYGQLGDGTLIDRPTPVKVNLPASLEGKASAIGVVNATAYAWSGAKPAFTVQPQSVSAPAASAVSLAAMLSQPGVPAAYQWKKEVVTNGVSSYVAIPGATSPIYPIASLGAGDAGRYVLEALTPSGVALSQPAEVGLLSTAPAFDLTVAPAPLTLNVGDALSLTLTPTTPGPFSYQWRKDGVAIAGATAATYALDAASAGASGRYTLVVSNGLGSATSAAVQVQVGPVVTLTGGSIAAWGSNLYGQLGDGKGMGRTSFVPVDKTGVLAGGSLVQVSAGWAHSVGLTSTGKIVSWGMGNNGRLGNASSNHSAYPVQVQQSGVLAGKTVTAVVAGNNHSIALTSDGAVYGWGGNSSGQIGNGNTTESWVPAAVVLNGSLTGKTVSKIFAYGDFSLALSTDGKLYAWGNNGNGQLGNGTTTNSSVPVEVNTTGVLSGKTITHVAPGGGYLGGGHVLVRTSDGLLFSWGYNLVGQLGNGTTTQSSVPVAVTMSGAMAGRNIAGVAAGYLHSLAWTPEGDVFAWGSNASGQLGNGTLTQQTLPTPVNPGAMVGKTVVAAAGGGAFSFFLASDGSVFSTGANNYGQLASGDFIQALVPVVASVPAGVTQISAGINGHAILLTSAGDAYSSGWNQYGQIGDGTNFSSPVPTLLPPSLFGGKTVRGVVGGFEFASALTSDGSLFSWGLTSSGYPGALGLGTLSVQMLSGSSLTLYPSANVPQALQSFGMVAAISGANQHALAVDTEGRPWAWGSNSAGALGNGSTTVSPSPAQIPESAATVGKRFASIAAGGNWSFLLSSDGKLFATGFNGNGQLGIGSTTNSPVPVLVGGSSDLAAQTVLSVASSFANAWAGASYALTVDGKLYAWGYNGQGQVGNGTTTIVHTPVQIQIAGSGAGGAAFETVVAVAAAGSTSNWGNHVLALTASGKLYAWGLNDRGQLGNGSTSSSTIPLAVTMGAMAGKSIVAIAAGASLSMALTSDGCVYAWGDNSAGGVGDGTFINRTLPVKVSLPASLEGNATGIAFSGGAGFAWSGAQAGFGLQPQSVGAAAGSAVSLSTMLHAPGMPVSYQWKKAANVNGVTTYTPIAGATQPLYAIASLDAAATGSYVLEALTPLGAVQSEPATVGILTAPPSFDLSSVPAPVTLNAGGALSLSFTLAAGSGPFTYQWRKDGAPVSGATASSYAVSAAKVGDSGVYSLVVTNALGSATSASVSVTVNGPPVDATPTVLAWGSNVSGQIGDGNGIGRTAFVPPDMTGVLAGKKIVQYGAGINHAVVLADDGKLYAWGQNDRGQFGNGTTVSSAVPVAVTMGALAGKTITSVKAGSSFSAALTSDGKVYAWGAGTTGQLGTGSSLDSWVPVAVVSSGALAGKTVTQIGCGVSFMTVLTQDNKLFSWGANPSGELGNGNTTSSNVPVAVTMTAFGTKTIQKLAVGGYHTLVLTQDFFLFGWGTNASGQLGLNSTGLTSSPAAVTQTGALSGKTVTDIAAGYYHSLALSQNGQVFSWGQNTYGQLGNNTSGQQQVPIVVGSVGALSSKTVTAIGASYYSSAALTSDGMLATWGRNDQGQLATGDFVNYWIPTNATLPAGKTFNAIVSGTGGRTVLFSTGGEVYAAGHNSNSQLGDGSTQYQTTPVALTAAAFGNKTIAALLSGGSASQNSATLTSDGTLFAWGTNLNGQLGFGAQPNGTFVPVAAPASLAQAGVLVGKSVLSASMGSSHMLALTTDGLVAAWGSNTSGQLGTGNANNASTPVWVGQSGSIYGEVIISVAAAGDASLALTSDGRVYAWGVGTSGQLGNGATGNSSNPVLVGSLLQGKTVSSIAGSVSACYALTVDGQVFAWGSEASGQLGNGSTSNVALPVLVTGALTGKRIVAVRPGNNHVLALGDDGQIYAWGLNASGQLGNNSTTALLTPLAVGGLSGKTIVSIAAGNNASLALTSLGELYAWGDNSSGQLGDGTFTNRLVPTLVTVPPAYASLKFNAVALMGATAYAWNSGTIALATQPVSAAAVLGSPVALSVAVSNPAGVPVSYQWKKQSGSAPNFTYTPIAGATGPSYSIASFAAQHVGTYLVDVVSPLGMLTSNTAELGSLTTPPTVPATVPAPVSLAVGGTLSLSVPVTGSGPFTYLWRKDGVPISGATGATYTLSNAPASATGAYTLVVSNALGTVVSQPTAVTVGDGAMGPLGNVLVWGDNSSGQVGLPVYRTVPGLMTIPTGNPMYGKTISKLVAGNAHVVALTSDGQLFGWGLNSNGQLGNASTTNSSVPVAVKTSAVLSGKTIVDVAAGDAHTVALAFDGATYSLYAWGANSVGQLGDGTMLQATEPVLVSTAGVLAGKTVKAVGAGYQFTVVLTTDGLLYSWGTGTSGQLGNGASVSSKDPVAVTMSGVLNNKTVTDFSVGYDFVVVRTSAGLAFSWGHGLQGRLGNGSTTTSNVPVAVTTTGALAGKTLLSVAAGAASTHAIATTGECFAWGGAGAGGTVPPRMPPTPWRWPLWVVPERRPNCSEATPSTMDRWC